MRFGLWLVGVAWLAASMGAQLTPKPASFACPVSQPNGPGEYEYKNEYLSTMLWPDGTVVFKPDGPGSVEEDGSLEMKFAWTRYIKGQLTIDGHRLDGSPRCHSKCAQCFCDTLGGHPKNLGTTWEQTLPNTVQNRDA